MRIFPLKFAAFNVKTTATSRKYYIVGDCVHVQITAIGYYITTFTIVTTRNYDIHTATRRHK